MDLRLCPSRRSGVWGWQALPCFCGFSGHGYVGLCPGLHEAANNAEWWCGFRGDGEPAVPKAPEDWRTPKPGGVARVLMQRGSVLECGCPLPLSRIIALDCTGEAHS